MKLSTPLPHSVRFSNFELDTRAGELRSGNRRIVVQEQPLQILLMLLKNPGEPVTREALQIALWPGNSFGDVEDCLNHAVCRLRDALGDTADQPRFIETLPHHGYRFIGPVEWLRPSSSDSKESNADSPPAKGGGLGALAGVIREPRLRRRTIILAISGLLLAVVGVLIAFNVAGLRDRALRTVGANRILPVHSIAVLPLENLSPDPAQEYFADSMTEELITHLGMVSALRVISRASVMPYKHTKSPLTQIARELNVDAIVKGAVLRSGDRVRITAQLIQPKPESHLWAGRYECELREELALQDEVARAIVDGITGTLLPPNETGQGNAGPVKPKTDSR